MARPQDLYAMIFFLPGFLCPSSDVAQDVHLLPSESCNETAVVRRGPFLLRSAIGRADVRMFRSVLDRDYAEDDATSCGEQGIGLISELLNHASLRPTLAFSEGTRAGFSVSGNWPPFCEFDLVDMREVALYGKVRAMVACEAVRTAVPLNYSSHERETGSGIRREIQLEFEKAGSQWPLRSSGNLAQVLHDAV